MKYAIQTCAAVSFAASAAALNPLFSILRGVHVAQQPRIHEGELQEYNISVPVDHFHNESKYEPHSDESFSLRYWFDDSHYKEGGPVIVLAAGETNAKDRLPFMDHGIASILAKATGGLAVLLEHRYYGASYPVSDLSVENLRFLSTEQALADTAYFAQHVQFDGLEHINLTAPEAAWIIYGGSYAGIFSALARKIYPDVFWGAISSSGVPAAIIDYWEYLEAARLFAPGDCAPVTQKLTHIVDKVLFGDDEAKVEELKTAFGLKELNNADFGSAISSGITGLQNTNWDPEIDYYGFGYYCGVVTSDALLFRSTAHFIPLVKDVVALGEFGDESNKLAAQMLNYIGYVNSIVQMKFRGPCAGLDVTECFSGFKDIEDTDLNGGMARPWTYQTCTQWGYFVTGSGVPEDQLPLLSRAVDLDYASAACPKVFNITTPPDVDSINNHGGLHFSFPRVAFVDGAQDPWRAAGTHRIGLDKRESTTSEPFILVDYGVHHWEENGPFNSSVSNFPPSQIVNAQQAEVDIVEAWMDEFAKHKSARKEQDLPGEL